MELTSRHFWRGQLVNYGTSVEKEVFMVVCPTANVGKLVASKADQVRDSQPAAGSRGRLGPKA